MTTAPQLTTLPNGIRVVSHHMAHVETVALGVWIGAGARHETAAQNGISHLLEHMAFKGTRRRTARGIAEEIEQVGGDLNAATSLETTAYYARVLKADVGTALEILADILQNSLFAADELEREREVILQEIAATQDSPDEIAYDLLQDVAFPDQPIGRPILGTPDSVTSFAATDLRSFLTETYAPSRMIVSAAGFLDHDQLVRHVEALFGALNGGKGGRITPARYVGGLRAATKKFEQSHVLVSFEGPTYRDADFYTAQVFSGLFGGGMSSRLFQEVRERRGLCYSIYSSCWAVADTGLFGVHAATGADMMAELIDVTGEEFARAAATVPTGMEVERSKAQLKAGLLMSLESSGARAEQMARQLLFFDRLVPATELIERVDVVTPPAVRDCAQRVLGRSKPSIVVVGAGRQSRAHTERAERALSGLAS